MGGSVKDPDLPEAKMAASRAKLFFAVWGVILFFWALALMLLVRALPDLVERDSVAEVLFGVSAVALTLVSLVVGFLAIVGWGELKRQIGGEIERTLEARLESQMLELRGRMSSGLGWMLGELSLDPDTLEPTNRERLAHAVDLCRAGQVELAKLAIGPRLNGLNNLTYYDSLFQEPHEGKSDYLLQQARELKEQGFVRDRPHLLLTYCRVVSRHASTNSEDWQQAKEIVRGLSRRADLPPYLKKEAEIYSALFADPEA